MNWDDLRILLALHRHQSLARAAQAVGVDATTIGRKIVALEKSLGAKLVRRERSGYALTPAATALVPAIDRMDRDATSIARLASGAEARVAGVVRVTAGDGLVNHVIVPALLALRERHPAIEIQLLGDVRVLDLARREADVAVRLVRPEGRSLVAKKLAPLSLGLFASEQYLQRRPAPSTPRELGMHDFVDYMDDRRKIPRPPWMIENVPPARVVVRATTTTTQLEACAAGVGIAMLYLPAGASRGLVRVLPDLAFERDAWLVYHQEDRENKRVRAVVAWLTELFAKREKYAGQDKREKSR